MSADDAFEVKAIFTLGAGSNGISPPTEHVMLQVGTFSTDFLAEEQADGEAAHSALARARAPSRRSLGGHAATGVGGLHVG